MNEHSDFLEEIVADDPANRLLAFELRSWRDSHIGVPVVPDDRLESRFALEPAIKAPARWRSWMQRPAIAFAASFAAVLVLGVGALALVARDSNGDTVATPTSSIAGLGAAEDSPGEITLPSDLSEQSGYAGCVFDEVTSWFKSGFASEDAPDILATCGTPPIPDLGPEAAAYRQDLQAFANCLAGELNSILPELPGLVSAGNDGLDDLATKCGEPPDPRDYGLTMPFGDLDWENLDLSQFNFGGLNLDDLNFEDFDLEEFLSNLPEGVLPQGIDLEELRSKFGNFDFNGFNFESCDPDSLSDREGISDPADFDFEGFLSQFEGGNMCGFDFFNFGDFDLEGLGLEDLNIDELLADLEAQIGNLDLEGFDLEGFDLQKLFDTLMENGEFDFEGWFGSGDFSGFFEDIAPHTNT